MNIHSTAKPIISLDMRSDPPLKWEPVISLNHGDTIFVNSLNSIDNGVLNYMIDENKVNNHIKTLQNNFITSKEKELNKLKQKNGVINGEDMSIVCHLDNETYYFYINLNKNFNYIIEIEADVISPLNTDIFQEELLKIFDTNDFFVSEIKFITKINNVVKKMFSNIPNKFETNKFNSFINLFNTIKNMITHEFVMSYIDIYTNINVTNDIEIEKLKSYGIYKEKNNIEKYINKYVFGKNLDFVENTVFQPTKTFIFYNNDTKTSNIIKDCKYDLSKILGHIDDIKFIECNTINGIFTDDKINELFDNKIYNDFASLEQIYSTIVELNNNLNKKINQSQTKATTNNEEKEVISWINFNYIITNNNEPDYRMSASKISELLEVQLGISPSDKMSFRNRLSKYLLNAGLQKKRFSDGFYYFGMKNKFDIKVNEKVKSIDEIMSERNKEFETYIKNNTEFESYSYITGFDGNDMAGFQSENNDFVKYIGSKTDNDVKQCVENAIKKLDKANGYGSYSFI